MRAAYAVIIAIFIGVCIAFVDLRGALLGYSHEIAQVLYYVGLDGLTIFASFLLAYSTRRKWWLNALLFVSVFFAMQSLWNMVYAIIAYYTGTLRFPLDLGLGQFVNAEQYFIGILVQLFLALLFYLAYRVSK